MSRPLAPCKEYRGIPPRVLLAILATACSTPAPPLQSSAHLQTTSTEALRHGEVPPIVDQSLAQAKPRSSPQTETYSVIVKDVPARDLLFAIARDASLNVDIHPGITGHVTLNAVKQTLPQLLSRIARQVDMRVEMDGPNLAVMPDTPFLRHYRLDYLNIARQVNGTVSTNTQITSAALANTPGQVGGGNGGNVSNTRIENSSKHQLWESLEQNIKDILRETDKLLPEGSSETLIEQNTRQAASGAAALPAHPGQRAAQSMASALQQNPNPASNSQASGSASVRRNTFREAASVIMHPESGTLTVRASGKQHERIQEFIDRVANAARRQVMIEATIVEVELADGYRQGIEWSRFREDGSGFGISPPGTTASLGDSANVVLKQLGKPLNMIAAVNLLESFGTTKVLSSPRLSVLNNQTALLKVVENYVYFNVKADTTTTANVGTTTTYTTTPQTVSVGLVVSVTPQISEHGEITVNIRPTITSIAREVRDPNPSLTIENRVPIIRTREIESVMRITSGDIAMLGGLMEDRIDYQTDRVPALGRIPGAGELLTRRDNSSRKSELVVFLRPVVIEHASTHGDYAAMHDLLPGTNFFAAPGHAQVFNPGRAR